MVPSRSRRGVGNPSTAYEHWNYPPTRRRASLRAIRRARARPPRSAFGRLCTSGPRGTGTPCAPTGGAAPRGTPSHPAPTPPARRARLEPNDKRGALARHPAVAPRAGWAPRLAERLSPLRPARGRHPQCAHRARLDVPWHAPVERHEYEAPEDAAARERRSRRCARVAPALVLHCREPQEVLGTVAEPGRCAHAVTRSRCACSARPFWAAIWIGSKSAPIGGE